MREKKQEDSAIIPNRIHLHLHPMEKRRSMKLLLRGLELLVTTATRVVVALTLIVSSVTKSFAVDMKRLVDKKVL